MTRVRKINGSFVQSMNEILDCSCSRRQHMEAEGEGSPWPCQVAAHAKESNEHR